MAVMQKYYRLATANLEKSHMTISVEAEPISETDLSVRQARSSRPYGDTSGLLELGCCLTDK
jgi:hypothetical protein